MADILSIATGAFGVAKPFLAALIAIAIFVYVGDRGSRLSLKRNNPCLAAFCIFAFAMGTGFAMWFLVMNQISTLVYGASINASYPLIIMYWAFWLLIGVLVSAKKLVYENAKRSGQYLQ